MKLLLASSILLGVSSAASAAATTTTDDTANGDDNNLRHLKARKVPRKKNRPDPVLLDFPGQGRPPFLADPDPDTTTTTLDENVETLKKTYNELGADKYWKANEVMQYEVANSFPLMPAYVREPGYVNSVPPIPVDDQETFTEDYLFREKKDFRTDPFSNEGARKCQFDRLDWVQKNPDILVNQLRLSGFSDEQITGIFTGDKPNGWESQELYEEFKKDLYTRGVECLSKDTDLENFAFTFSGSSASGYSTNPYKGKCSIPTWLTSLKSDLDFGIIADDVALTVAKTDIRKYLLFGGSVDRDTSATRFIIGTCKKRNDDTSLPDEEASCEPSNTTSSYYYEDERRLLDNRFVRYYDILGECFGDFWKEWESKTQAAIQFYIQQNKYRTPGWELVMKPEDA